MFTLDITPDDGETYRLVAKTRHVVRWERLGKGRSLSRLETPSLTDLVEIAHVTAVAEGRFTGSFDAFLDLHEVAGVDPAAEAAAQEPSAGGYPDDPDAGETGPTQPAP